MVFLDQEALRVTKGRGESTENLVKKEKEEMKASKVTWARREIED